MKKVLLTGGTGFIGYHLIKELHKRNIEFWAICRPGNSEAERIKGIKGAHIISCDLKDISRLPEICEEREFDAFFHLAWNGASGELRLDENVQMENVKCVVDCVKVAKELQCKKVIFAGTVCEKQVESIGEIDKFSNSSNYLIAKKYAHVMAQNIAKKIQQEIVWCNFYHPIGVFNKKNQIVASVIKKLLEGNKIALGDGKSLFDVIDVSDLVNAFCIMADTSLSKDTYFVGSGNPRLLKDYLETVKEIVNPQMKLGWEELDLVNLPMEEDWLDISEFSNETGFKVKVRFEDSIKQMREWMLNEEEYNQKKWDWVF